MEANRVLLVICSRIKFEPLLEDELGGRGETMSFFWSCCRGDNGRARRTMSDQERIKPGTDLASFVEHLSLKSGNMHSTCVIITTFELRCFL